MSFKKLVPSLAIASALSGCGAVHFGSHFSDGPTVVAAGKVETETRSTTSFHKVDASSVVMVDIATGPTESIVVTADKNVLPHLTTVVKDGVLKIDLRGSFENVGDIRVKVTAPKLDGVSASGATKVTMTGLSADNFDAHVDGASHLTINGSAKELVVQVDGASHVNLAGLHSSTIKGEINGASQVEMKGETDHLELILTGAAQLDASKMAAKDGNLDASGAVHATLGPDAKVQTNTSGAASVVSK